MRKACSDSYPFTDGIRGSNSIGLAYMSEFCVLALFGVD